MVKMVITLFIPSIIFNHYNDEGSLRKCSHFDTLVYARLPRSLAYRWGKALIRFTSWAEGDKKKFHPPTMKKIPDEDFNTFLELLFGPGTRPVTYELSFSEEGGRNSEAIVVRRFLTTDLLMQGLYHLCKELQKRLGLELTEVVKHLMEVTGKVRLGVFNTNKNEIENVVVALPSPLEKVLLWLPFDLNSILAYSICVAYKNDGEEVPEDLMEELENRLHTLINENLPDKIILPVEEECESKNITIKGKNRDRTIRVSRVVEGKRFFQVFFKNGEGRTFIWTPRWSEIRDLYKRAILYELEHYGFNSDEVEEFRSHCEFLTSLLQRLEGVGGRSKQA